MSAQRYDNESGSKPTQSAGNANGKPAIPVMMAVGAVVALILVSIALSLRGNRNAVQETTGRYKSGESTPVTQPAVQYPPSGSGDTATGNVSKTTGQVTGQGGQVVPPGPAVAPINGTGDGTTNPADTSQSSSAAMPSRESKTGDAATRRNIIAPPGPATSGNGQETAR